MPSAYTWAEEPALYQFTLQCVEKNVTAKTAVICLQLILMHSLYFGICCAIITLV